MISLTWVENIHINVYTRVLKNTRIIFSLISIGIYCFIFLQRIMDVGRSIRVFKWVHFTFYRDSCSNDNRYIYNNNSALYSFWLYFHHQLYPQLGVMSRIMYKFCSSFFVYLFLFCFFFISSWHTTIFRSGKAFLF